MTAKPNSTLNESLSALMDGESNDLDMQRVLNAMDSDESVRETWARYHASSHVVKGADLPDLSLDLSQSIMSAIEQEPTLSESKLGRLNSWWSGVGKTAVAACAAAGVVFGVQQYTTTAPGDAPGVATVAEATDLSSGAVVPQGFELPPLQARTVSTNSFTSKNTNALPANQQSARPSVVISNDELQEQINRLMFKHAEQASYSGGMGAIPFARISELTEEAKE